MLDIETKRKINSARQILVGKVPDPKSQVQQITTALIYKFMDDMDKQAQEMDKRASFFVGDFKKYSWSNLLDPKKSGQERLDLYAMAIAQMQTRKNIPEIFRKIFKEAFLPYRDPETLNLFLKEINGFTYEHSENLGNAFEYLLSIMGSQGDAGQFRTPRHIIDFIVEVVDPKKDETILDPACGTAGFLISNYKHINKHNSSNYNPKTDVPTFAQTDNKEINDLQIQSNGKYKGDKLDTKDRKNIANNIRGYDISPDMVTLSLANMYLHRFVSQEIHEYDTLSRDELWGDNFDVILANPPFMTPKGGINPHNKFMVKANKAEVLFVDYIAEHLKQKGRAGIIVPEGIIFQSANAYRKLREHLIETWGLWAVVSLPSGVFNPYSGVKTSILFLDKERSKQTKDILFIKVENDGFDLGAQRRKIEANDLPQAFQILEQWKIGRKKKQEMAHWIKKEKIKQNESYDLSVGMYIERKNTKHEKYPLVELGEVCEIKRGSTITKQNVEQGNIPVIASAKEPSYYHNEANRIPPVITVSSSGEAGFVNFFNKPIFASDCFTIQPNELQKVDIKYIYGVLKSKQKDIYKLQKGVAQKHVYPKDVQHLKIPLPPLEIQKQIVEEIEIKQKAIDNAKEIIKNLERERDAILAKKLKS